MRSCGDCGVREVDERPSYCATCHEGWVGTEAIPMLNWVPMGCLRVKDEVMFVGIEKELYESSLSEVW